MCLNLLFLIIIFNFLFLCSYLFTDVLGLVSCSSHVDCQSFNNAFCEQGYCKCGSSDLVCESKASYKFANKLEENCGSTIRCNLNNSECNQKSNKCFCKSGYFGASDKRSCVKVPEKIGDFCTENVHCLSVMPLTVCAENKCVCEKKSRENNGTCLNIAVLGEACAEDSECLRNSSSCRDYKCSCIPRYVASKDRCLPLALRIEDACVEDVQCTNVLGEGSHCLNGCQCKYFYHFEQEVGKCVEDVLLNQICETHKDCHQPGQGLSRMSCVDGQCKCQVGYWQNGGYCREITSSGSNLKKAQLLFYVTLFVFKIVII